MQVKTKDGIKKSVDVCMTILLLFLMAYQVTGEAAHEWIGIAETVLVIFHQILNRRWYAALFKGRYHAYRGVTTILNVALILSFLLTAFCGMSMSGHAVPFLYGMAPVSFVRRFHLSMSHWTFVLMGMHLGFHIPAMTARIRISDKAKLLISIAFCAISGYGFYLFLKAGMLDYLFFRAAFAFLDYGKAAGFVFFENLLMLFFFVFAGAQCALVCRSAASGKEKKNPLLPVVFLMAAVIIGLLLNTDIVNRDSGNNMPDLGASGQHGIETTSTLNSSQTEEENVGQASAETDADVDDGYLLISAGTFLMGSSRAENWRIEDEVQHEVAVSAFYVDPYETMQENYEQLMGGNPSTFVGGNLPVENISWLDAIQYANKKSEAAGLTPAYTIMNGSVSWDRSANGYRLPTEAEWEYACRAGTATPFNTEKSLSAEEANFYGHYPYEIEENYFNDSVLEARPGEYRQTTVPVGSFEPNAWGLYDCHGNVNEWCWDYYSDYDISDNDNPAGTDTGTRHVYRGGGWNDFAKNLRSAYRAAGQADMASYNLGVRLVRNAGAVPNKVVTASYGALPASYGGTPLIAYFSWGGNTRGIAQEIQRQTGADILEISPVRAYSSDYNTVLMEAQEDQHNQARPKLDAHVEDMKDYDVILLGYPNWWASIPMPVATFLEEYDFSGKKIIPFCSHGGGRFGQSLTAIAKLAPDADMGEGLSVHYSVGSSMPDDVAAWLEANGVSTK